jgi:hypothetical protein
MYGRVSDVSESTCPYKGECEFFARSAGHASERILREIYCAGHPERCEILTRHLAKQQVPAGMLPDGTVQ